MPKRWHSTMILVAVFVLGIVGGIATMVWAWPGLRARYFPHHRPTLAQYLKPLNLSPQQLAQVQGVYKETGQRGHDIYLQFVPEYSKICEDFTATRKQERDAFAPVRQQELSKLQAVMTADQWQRFSQMRAQSQRNQPQRQPDVCRHLPGYSGPSGPGPGPGRGPGHGHQGPGGPGPGRY